MKSYAYHRPRTLDEAFARMAETPGARWIAGGTDLLVHLKKRRIARPPALVSLRNVAELTTIEDGDALRIGASVPITDVAAHPAVRERHPALVDAIGVLGSRQIQNVATLAGNLCNASPAADSVPPLLVDEARVELRSPGGVRTMPLEEFFLGPGQTALRADEILAAVLLDRPPAGSRSRFLRKGRVAMDLAIVIVAARLVVIDDVCREARLAAGAVAPTPVRLRAAESILVGSRLEEESIANARRAACEAVSPITDLRSTAEYRRELLGVFVARAVRAVSRTGLEPDGSTS